MELDFDDTVMRGLRRYVDLVSTALGMTQGQAYMVVECPATAYLPLDGRLPGHPDRDVALVWDEHRGWSLAAETDSGEELVIVADMATDVLPPSDAVAEWTRRARRGDQQMLRRRPTPVSEDVRERLAAYARTPWIPVPRSA